MPILNKNDLLAGIEEGNLVLNPLRDADGIPIVEPASYDLRAGIVLWKNEHPPDIEVRDFDESKAPWHQPIVTLRPGQMVFVITHEELKLTKTISATVYSRNKLQKENILALNAGHIDPGYEGPIMIRLINLSAVEWPLRVGEPIFTVVFHTVRDADGLSKHAKRSKKETLDAAMKTAADAFSNPFHDLYRAQIDKQLQDYETKLRDKFSDDFLRKNTAREYLVITVASLVGILAVVTRIPWDKVLQWCKWVLNIK
jgi:deoxycytidine triphosphate deaminase